MKEKFDTVITNPPFGTKHNKGTVVFNVFIFNKHFCYFICFAGIDMDFLYIASKIANNAIYSFHKTSTRKHVLKKTKDFGLQANVIAGR